LWGNRQESAHPNKSRNSKLIHASPMITSRPWLGIIGTNPMDRKAEEASEVQRKSVVILSDRSREIIRLFEERERKRHQVLDSLAATPFRQTASKLKRRPF
jgi:hypothetical protein